VPEGILADSASGGATDQAPTTAPAANHPETSPPKQPPLAPGKRTAERMALDAVAAGSFDEAANLLTALSAAHPDDPSYKEAARILREKSGQPK
jgi:predicted Zn-dependent protease